MTEDLKLNTDYFNYDNDGVFDRPGFRNLFSAGATDAQNNRGKLSRSHFRRILKHAFLACCQGIQVVVDPFVDEVTNDLFRHDADSSGELDWNNLLERVTELSNDFFVNKVLTHDSALLFIEDIPESSWGAYEDYKKQELLNYNSVDFNFQQLLKTMLMENYAESDLPLEKLHKLLPGYSDDNAEVPVVSTFMNNQRTLFHRRFYDSPLLPQFRELYRKFIANYISPQFQHDRYLVFQKQPTFRCHLPNNTSVGACHVDALYGHADTEINFWLPVTSVHDSNSLYIESRPGTRDYKPVRANNGQVLRFFGSRCSHFDLRNETDTTRVCFDFRVIPHSLYKDGGKTANEAVQLKIGSYFQIYDRQTGKISDTL